jgi:hypothetical protein
MMRFVAYLGVVDRAPLTSGPSKHHGVLLALPSVTIFLTCSRWLSGT